MSERTVEFVDDLVKRFPGMRSMFEEHISDFGEVLPHLFLGDVTRYAVGLFLQSRASSRPDAARASDELTDLLDFLEKAFVDAHPEIDNLLAVSFLENLPRPNLEEGWEIRALVGPTMKRQLDVIG